MGVLTNFDFLNDELLESSEELAFPSWGDEDRRSSFGDSLDVRSINKSTLRDTGSLSGSEQDLTPRESSDDEDEVRALLFASWSPSPSPPLPLSLPLPGPRTPDPGTEMLRLVHFPAFHCE